MDIIAEIRRRHFVSKEKISSIARSLGLSRPTVRKHLKTEAEPEYRRQTQYAPKLGEFKALLTKWLETEALLPKKQRRTAMRLYEGLIIEGYAGAYDSVRRFVKQWKAENKDTQTPQQRLFLWRLNPAKFVNLTGVRKLLSWVGWSKSSKWRIFVCVTAAKCLSLLISGKHRKC